MDGPLEHHTLTLPEKPPLKVNWWIIGAMVLDLAALALLLYLGYRIARWICGG